jgi:hypothetical protein
MFYIRPMINAAATSPAQPAPCPHCSRETEDARLQRYADGLKRLAEYGLVLAEALAGEARAKAVEAESPAVPPAETENPGKTDLAQAFDRVARAVRLSFMLEERFHADFAARRQARANAAAQQAVNAAQGKRRRNRAAVERVVTEAIGDATGDKKERDALGWQLKHRLDRPDMIEDLSELPINVLVARICRDLGFDPDWDRWRDEAWFFGEDDGPPEETPACPICGCGAGGQERPPEMSEEVEPPETTAEMPRLATGTDPP